MNELYNIKYKEFKEKTDRKTHNTLVKELNLSISQVRNKGEILLKYFQDNDNPTFE